MSGSLLRQLGERARARDAGARRLEASRGAPLADPAAIVAALDAQRSSEARGVSPARAVMASRGWVFAGAATLAAAAAVVLAVRVGPAREAAPADYTVSVNGRVETTRSAPREALVTLEARDDAMQEVVVRPRAAVRAKLEVRVLVVRDGARVPTSIVPEISELGAVRFDVAGPVLRGATALVVVLESPRSARDAAEIRIPVERGEEKN